MPCCVQDAGGVSAAAVHQQGPVSSEGLLHAAVGQDPQQQGVSAGGWVQAQVWICVYSRCHVMRAASPCPKLTSQPLAACQRATPATAQQAHGAVHVLPLPPLAPPACWLAVRTLCSARRCGWAPTRPTHPTCPRPPSWPPRRWLLTLEPSQSMGRGCRTW